MIWADIISQISKYISMYRYRLFNRCKQSTTIFAGFSWWIQGKKGEKRHHNGWFYRFSFDSAIQTLLHFSSEHLYRIFSRFAQCFSKFHRSFWAVGTKLNYRYITTIWYDMIWYDVSELWYRENTILTIYNAELSFFVSRRTLKLLDEFNSYFYP